MKQTVIVERGQEIQFNAHGGSFITVPLNKGITGRCATTKKTILVHDVSFDPDYVSDQIECKSEIAVPIVYKDRVIGVIDSESTQPNRYNDKIKRTLEGVSSLLAIKLNELENYRKLTSKNAELESLVKENPMAIAMLDLDYNYLKVSQKWIDHFVKDKSKSIIGLNHFGLNPNIPLRWKKMIERAFKGESLELQKESYERKNGEVSIYSAKVNPWFASEGKIGGVILMVDDVTEQVQTKLKLSQSSEELQQARRYGKLFSWEFVLETGVFKWSGADLHIPTFKSDTEYSLDKVFGFIDSEYHADFNKVLTNAMKNKQSYSFIHPFDINGTKYWLHNRGSAIYYSQNRYRKGS